MKQINEISNVYEVVKELEMDYKQENLVMLVLDTKNKVISKEIVFKGGLNSCIIDPKTLFRKALEKNGNAIIIAHNHPSGDTAPSDEDTTITEKLIEIGELINLKVLDHVIFSDTKYESII